MTTSSGCRSGTLLQAADLKKMILGANVFFEREKETINALNVFPVPDGDTGTNMSMTLKAAAEASITYTGQSIGELSELIANRALMGARGNSGVILSQLLRGIARGLRRKEAICVAELSKAFQYGVVYAYRAVSKPVEGTILTVAREMARGARQAVRHGESFQAGLAAAIGSGKKALEKTTEMLPELKEAGVVDAGGLGLLVFLEGCLYALKRSVNDLLHPGDTEKPPPSSFKPSPGQLHNQTPVITLPQTLDNPYCTELFIRSGEEAAAALQDELAPLGDSLLVAAGNGGVKIHLHSATPGLVLETARRHGTLHAIKIDNMEDQLKPALADKEIGIPATTIVSAQKNESPGMVVVSFGEGFREIFLSLGASEVVFGGQTMNPKVEDLLRAVETHSLDPVIILPNNKNIIMVAQQAAALAKRETAVVETRSLPEGLAALLAYSPEADLTENLSAMQSRITKVATGLLTYATRDSLQGTTPVRKGDYLALEGESITAAGSDRQATALALAEKLLAPGRDILTIFYGRETTREEAASLAHQLEKNHPQVEVELQYGGQPLYYYIFSAE